MYKGTYYIRRPHAIFSGRRGAPFPLVVSLHFVPVDDGEDDETVEGKGTATALWLFLFLFLPLLGGELLSIMFDVTTNASSHSFAGVALN